MLHKNVSVGDNHYIQEWEPADEIARLAISVTSEDVGKVARQLDTGKFYILTDDSPSTWGEMTSDGGGASVFTQLTDVPSSYTGQGGKVVSVKDAEDGLEFVVVESGTTTFTQLTDVPSSYAGAAGQTVAVNATEDGLEFVEGGGGGETGPAFRAIATTIQSLSSGADVKVLFGTETFDTDNCFASSRFTPNKAGYYQINAKANLYSDNGSSLYIILRKNDLDYSLNRFAGPTTSFYNFPATISDIVYMNGTTDYLEIFVTVVGTGGAIESDSSTETSFSGHFIRS